MLDSNVDPSPHIPLIYRVINQMGIEGSDKEEAFSEGLVIITRAAKKYDPSRGVPLANWLGKNLNWSLRNWRSEQRRIANFEAPTETSQVIMYGLYESSLQSSVGLSTLKQIRNLATSTVTSLENHVTLREALDNMPKILSKLECSVILLHALDVSGLDIANILNISAVAVSRIKKKAQAKLREALQ